MNATDPGPDDATSVVPTVVSPPDRPLALRTPQGDVLRVQADMDGMDASLLASLLAGQELAHQRATSTQRALAGRLSEELARRQLRHRQESWGQTRVLLVRTPLGQDLAAALADRGADVEVVDADVVLEAVSQSRPRVVVWADDTRPPHPGWAGLDALPVTGVGWLRAAREGDVVRVEPLALDPDDPTSEQVRGRRLAASPAAPELRALWDVDGAGPVAAHAPSPAARALVLHHVIEVLDAATATCRGLRDEHRLAEHRRTLLRVDMVGLRTTSHSVLAYPRPDSAGVSLR